MDSSIGTHSLERMRTSARSAPSPGTAGEPFPTDKHLGDVFAVGELPAAGDKPTEEPEPVSRAARRMVRSVSLSSANYVCLLLRCAEMTLRRTYTVAMTASLVTEA